MEFRIRLGDREANRDVRPSSNKVSTTKYNLLTFFPKSIFFFLMRLANCFFLVTSVFISFPGIAPVSPLSVVIPFLFVVAVTLTKEALEDLKRRRNDIEENSSETLLWENNGWVQTKWKDIRTGDIVKIMEYQQFPADLLFMHSEQGICKLQTANLDGERNLKTKESVSFFDGHFQGDKYTGGNFLISVNPPNQDLFAFSGYIQASDSNKQFVEVKNLLWRGTILMNTSYVIGMVVYPGLKSKIMLSKKTTPFKLTRYDKLYNYVVIIMFGVHTVLCILAASLSIWFNEKYEDAMFLDRNSNGEDWVRNYGTYFILINGLIPLALVVALDIVKIFQYLFFQMDVKLFDEEQNQPVKVFTFNIMEELGMIDYVFSDKTGTLTANSMEFRGFSIGDRLFENNSDILSNRNQTVDEFFNALLLCHELEVEGNKRYVGSSPDEITLLETLKLYGHSMIRRDKNYIEARILENEAAFSILMLNEFSSERKRMSIIVKDSENNIKLYIKGADSAILSLLDNSAQPYLDFSESSLKSFSEKGLRTLLVAYKELSQDYFEEWLRRYESSKESLDPENTTESLIEEIETDVTLLGVTALEDKLQVQVPETIDRLTQAGIKVWMITGDKLETARKIALNCNLIHEDWEILTYRQSDSLESLMARVETSTALVIEGDGFMKCLEQPQKLFELCQSCKTVVVCRATPLLKAQAVKFMKKMDKKCTTLAIGDGGNDVAMIQMADIGIGIFGKEGLQAANSSDIAIGKFMFLHDILFVHGRWNMSRMGRFLLFFFFKSLVYVLPQFYYSAYNGFSGQTIFESWAILMYNLIYTSLGPVVLGISDQDLNPRMDPEIEPHLPELYKEMKDSEPLSLKKFLYWGAYMIYGSLVVFYIPFIVYGDEVVDGKTAGLWTISICMFTGLLYATFVLLFFIMNHWGIIQTFSCWLGAVLYFPVFFFIFDSSPVVPNQGEGSTALGTFKFWAGVFAIVWAVFFPYYALVNWKRFFEPTLADKLRYNKRTAGFKDIKSK